MITLQNVTKTYQRGSGIPVVALDQVNLDIKQGAIHGIVGQSGAGKSTLIRIMTALTRPTSGTIKIDGEDLGALSGEKLRQARRKIGMVFQQANLFDTRTAGGNVRYALKLAKWPKEQISSRVAELLQLVGLEDREDSYPSELSGGQRQRVGIARAMASSPPVLLCDEPTSALDQESTAQVLELLKKLRDEAGVTIVVITHEMSVVTEICDSVTLLADGKVRQSGELLQVLRDVDSPLSRALVPFPSVEDAAVARETVLLDVSFTSTPGVPTAAAVLGKLAAAGGDVTAGKFESVGELQVGRLAISVPKSKAEQLTADLRDEDLVVQERAR